MVTAGRMGLGVYQIRYPEGRSSGGTKMPADPSGRASMRESQIFFSRCLK